MTQDVMLCKTCKCFTCAKGPYNRRDCNHCGECVGGFKYCPAILNDERGHFTNFAEERKTSEE